MIEAACQRRGDAGSPGKARRGARRESGGRVGRAGGPPSYVPSMPMAGGGPPAPAIGSPRRFQCPAGILRKWGGRAARDVVRRAASALSTRGKQAHRYVRSMDLMGAAAWGLAGGLAAGLVSMSASVVAAGFKWPWRDNEDGIGPRLFVTGVGLVIGALVAAAAHGQMSGGWPAFIMGVSAPSVIRGALSRVEVTERKADKVEVAVIEREDEHAA